MLLRLEISIYNIKRASPEVLKGCLDYNFYILLRVIGLYHLPVPFLRRSTKTPLIVFAPPPLHTTLVTPHHESLVLRSLVSSFKALGKPLRRVFLRKKRPPFSFLIHDTMLY